MVKPNDAIALILVLLISFFALVTYLLFRLVSYARNAGAGKTISYSYTSDDSYDTVQSGRVNVPPPRPPGNVNVAPQSSTGGRVNIPPPAGGNVNVHPVGGGGHVNVAPGPGPGRGAVNIAGDHGAGRGGAVNIPPNGTGQGRGGNVNIPPVA